MHHARRPMARLRHLTIAALLAALAAPPLAADEDETIKLIGSGASFPAPLYLRWFRDYYKQHRNVHVDYQSIGTAGGVRDVTEGRVDFAGSDLMLGDDELGKIPGGGRQVPFAAGGIAVIYNLDGVPALKLSRAALIGMFSGAISRWNDPAIAATNEGVDLPDATITIVARADASGTSYKFTRYLSSLDDAFAAEVGTAMQPNWPALLKKRGTLIRGRGNDGVAASVRAIPGSLGYVQYAYGFLPGISIASLENKAGRMVAPEDASFNASLVSIIEDQSLQNAVDPAGEGAYPALGLSWLIFRGKYDDPRKDETLAQVIAYAMGPGQDVVTKLGYIPFPEALRDYVRGQVTETPPAR
jgi:phosphate transport system substrate-binding protein